MAQRAEGNVDSRTKLAWLGTLLVVLFLFTTPEVQFVALGLVLGLALAGSRRGYFRLGALILALKILAGMLVVVLLLQGFIHGGEHVLFGLSVFRWQARFTLEGLLFGAVTVSRFITISLAFMMFFLTTDAYALSLALYKLRIPYKYAYLMPMALERFPKMVELMNEIEFAQATRGFDIQSGGVWQKFKNIMPILIPLVIMSLREAGNMSVALELKGFGRAEKVSFLHDRQLTRLDGLLIWLAGTTLLVALVVKIVGLLKGV
jgi:energy-coupling factor transport system permease protein